MEPAPICTCGTLVPLVLTPLNITVIRFAVAGIPVKSILVPDVEATAVPEVIVPDQALSPRRKVLTLAVPVVSNPTPGILLIGIMLAPAFLLGALLPTDMYLRSAHSRLLALAG